MKAVLILVLAAFSVGAFSQAKLVQSKVAAPKYDKSVEAVFTGKVQEVRERQCAVGGGVGSHLVMRLNDARVIEVHLSSTRFIRQYELVFHPGETLEITGVEVSFEGVETIFARKIKRGTDEFLFRDSDGKPIW